MLQPLEVPQGRWEDLTTDFIFKLPISQKGNDGIQVVVDRFSKRVHIYPVQERDSAEEILHKMRCNVFKYHGTPKSIVSDRDTRFLSKYWQSMMESLGIKSCLSTSNHQETDGQSERFHRTLWEMLRPISSNKQNNLEELLPDIEFNYNNSTQASTGFTPFMADIGRHPNCATLARKSTSPVPVVDLIDKLKLLKDKIQPAIMRAQANQKSYADAARQAGNFTVGDQVLLDRTAIPNWSAFQNTTKAKMLPLRLGPFRITKVEGLNNTLKLPHTLKVHPIFHQKLLTLYKTPDFNRKLEQPMGPLEELSGNPVMEVEAILDHRTKRKSQQYLVHWKGYSH